MKKSRILELLNSYENIKDPTGRARVIFAKYLAWSLGKDGKSDEFTYTPLSFATQTILALNILRVSDEQEILGFRQQYIDAILSRDVNQIGNLLDLSTDNNCIVLMIVIEQTLKEVFDFGQGTLYFSAINTQIEATALALRNCVISFVTEVWMKGLGNIACLNSDKKRTLKLGYIEIQLNSIESKIELRLSGVLRATNLVEIAMQFDPNLDCYIMPSYSIETRYFSLGNILCVLEDAIEIWREHLTFDAYKDLDIRYID